jgi:hypothetical protein
MRNPIITRNALYFAAGGFAAALFAAGAFRGSPTD